MGLEDFKNTQVFFLLSNKKLYFMYQRVNENADCVCEGFLESEINIGGEKRKN